MSSETLHAPREQLSKQTLTLHYAITSLMEDLEAVDWYRQRADDCDDASLKNILLHNMREEMEHAEFGLTAIPLAKKCAPEPVLVIVLRF